VTDHVFRWRSVIKKSRTIRRQHLITVAERIGKLQRHANTVRAEFSRATGVKIGIFAVLFTVGPTAAQLIVWRIGLYLSRVAAEMLGVPQAAKTVAAVDDTLSLLLGVILFVGALFIIALAVTLR
jgi:hypothetical protein